MKPVQIREDIWWVGGIDWDLRNFHGYSTERGSTYNAYLIVDEKITLIDNVKHYLYDEMIERIAQVVDPAKIDIIVQNHAEMDHSGGLPKLMKLCPNAKLYCSPNGVKNLEMQFHQDWPFSPVQNGQTLNLGKRNLQFVLTPMVHWPDNMVSYCPEEKILFSNDAFGQHIASSERFDDEYPYSIYLEQARKYYANIVLPYGKMVQKVLADLGGVQLEMLCPSHGLITRKYLKELLGEYVKWSSNTTEKKALIIYDTMWDSTRKMAMAVESAFEEKGIKTTMFNLQHTHISDIMTEAITASHICIGSPTLNNNILPTVASFLTYMCGLAPTGRIGLAFGSYGWGGQGVGIINDRLTEAGFTMLKPIRFQYVPGQDDLAAVKKHVEDQL